MAPSPIRLTLLDLVAAVSEYAETDREIVAAVVHLVNSGAVRLGGSFGGARFELGPGQTGPGAEPPPLWLASLPAALERAQGRSRRPSPTPSLAASRPA